MIETTNCKYMVTFEIYTDSVIIGHEMLINLVPFEFMNKKEIRGILCLCSNSS